MGYTVWSLKIVISNFSLFTFSVNKKKLKKFSKSIENQTFSKSNFLEIMGHFAYQTKMCFGKNGCHQWILHCKLYKNGKFHKNLSIFNFCSLYWAMGSQDQPEKAVYGKKCEKCRKLPVMSVYIRLYPYFFTKNRMVPQEINWPHIFFVYVH